MTTAISPTPELAAEADARFEGIADPVEQALAAALLHGLTMLLTSAVVAVVVYEVVGLRVLRSAWVNLDRLWGGAFLLAGAAVWLA